MISDEKIYENSFIKRDEEVLKEIISYKTQTQIFKKIFVSERTLYHHIENIYKKLGVENKVEL
ncbi:helix-turn-helix transcriptional regulator [Anaerococcus sp. NML200537]|uniref:helix-turn-helix domain-containing protein n=1 Tax=Anaerococcus sp. NML200537 TaxID=2954485 RepID=UPI0022373CA6|nr:helix-turn-helix transcriptional regulator [Anaerococcus sp. NML200537]MCW6700781.1 helix-turn-helix transcriptional regulator [Anaerococcus sp. NML200537]